MKKFFAVLVVSLVTTLNVWACGANGSCSSGCSAHKTDSINFTAAATESAPLTDTQNRLEIKGKLCKSCTKKIEKALMSVEGVEKVDLNLKSGMATVTWKKKGDVALLVEAIKAKGYEVGATQ